MPSNASYKGFQSSQKYDDILHELGLGNDTSFLTLAGIALIVIFGFIIVFYFAKQLGLKMKAKVGNFEISTSEDKPTTNPETSTSNPKTTTTTQLPSPQNSTGTNQSIININVSDQSKKEESKPLKEEKSASKLIAEEQVEKRTEEALESYSNFCCEDDIKDLKETLNKQSEVIKILTKRNKALKNVINNLNKQLELYKIGEHPWIHGLEENDILFKKSYVSLFKNFFIHSAELEKYTRMNDGELTDVLHDFIHVFSKSVFGLYQYSKEVFHDQYILENLFTDTKEDQTIFDSFRNIIQTAYKVYINYETNKKEDVSKMREDIEKRATNYAKMVYDRLFKEKTVDGKRNVTVLQSAKSFPTFLRDAWKIDDFNTMMVSLAHSSIQRYEKIKSNTLDVQIEISYHLYQYLYDKLMIYIKEEIISREKLKK